MNMETVELTPEDLHRVNVINARVPGWSDGKQYAFFKGVLAQRLDVKDILMLGVYQGRDISYILDVAARYHAGRVLKIVGVDKFNDGPCADWPKAKRALGWQAAGFGAPPDGNKAAHHLGCFFDSPFRAFNESKTVCLLENDDAEFFKDATSTYDLVYLDTSHDYETVKRQLSQVPRVCRENGLICGDDYSDEGTWGVKRAVSEGFTRHSVFANWIWYSNRSDLKTL